MHEGESAIDVVKVFKKAGIYILTPLVLIGVVVYIILAQGLNEQITESEVYQGEIVEHNVVEGIFSGSDIVLDNGDSFRLRSHSEHLPMMTIGSSVEYKKTDEDRIFIGTLKLIKNSK